MKNNKRPTFDLKINRKFLKQLTCIDEGSKDGIYVMVLDSELRSMLSAPRTSSKEDLDAVTKSNVEVLAGKYCFFWWTRFQG